MLDRPPDESAWSRAIAESVAIYKSTPFQVVLVIVGLLGAGFAVIFTADSDTPVQTQVAVPIVCGLLALALTFAAVLLVQMLTAPYAQRNALLRERKVPKESAPPFDLEMTLRDKHRRGLALHADLEGQAVLTSEEQEEIETWTAGVIEFLSAHGLKDEAKAFISATNAWSDRMDRLSGSTSALGQIIGALDDGS